MGVRSGESNESRMPCCQCSNHWSHICSMSFVSKFFGPRPHFGRSCLRHWSFSKLLRMLCNIDVLRSKTRVTPVRFKRRNTGYIGSLSWRYVNVILLRFCWLLCTNYICVLKVRMWIHRLQRVSLGFWRPKVMKRSTWLGDPSWFFIHGFLWNILAVSQCPCSMHFWSAKACVPEYDYGGEIRQPCLGLVVSEYLLCHSGLSWRTNVA